MNIIKMDFFPKYINNYLGANKSSDRKDIISDGFKDFLF